MATAWDSQGGPDVGFFATHCIDEDRIIATGHSSGGFFTNVLGCQQVDVQREICQEVTGRLA